MKKVFGISLIILSVVIFDNQIVSAEDGSLKIDTRTSQDNGHKENFYIEQETELTKLFDETLTKTISRKKEEESISYKKDKTLIFDRNVNKESLVDNYTKNLFLTNGYIANTTSAKINLKEKQDGVNWYKILLLIMGISITMVSVIKLFYRKKVK
ncbi:type VII secretion protein EssA [Gemella cuniculi]|uniref:type VII secretion protein EssA n=1 Tax=Gemella cuniculi TaxID=150240 RepID=UPI00040C410B|nr:type VII secretion protein EssA [Gemella cuniculi]